MGRRQRRRETAEGGRKSGAPRAADATYTDVEGGVLVLRGSLTAGARREYLDCLVSGPDPEDARQRATELLFERLVVSWAPAGLELTGQKQLLGRYRLASREERQFVLDSLRTHAAEHFPELQVP